LIAARAISLLIFNPDDPVLGSESRFQRLLHDDLNSWGDAPGSK
jgi:hypothetical protein